jgi:hypothetical protein
VRCGSCGERTTNRAVEADPRLTAWLDGRGTRDIVERESGILPALESLFFWLNPKPPTTITYRIQERIVITPARPSREDTELFHGE